MFSMLRIFIAFVSGASALRVMDERRVLVLGCSLDRNAIAEYFCHGHGDQNDVSGNHLLQTAWCFNEELNVRLGYIFHPGVGQNGDLHQPTAQMRGLSTNAILTKYANETSFFMLKANPDLVVVDSSLWDLMVWRLGSLGGVDGHAYTFPEPKEVTEGRVKQWCEHDLPNLLDQVSQIFPTSRIAFRTAPTIDHTPKYEKFEKHDIEMLYHCITSQTIEGMLFSKYEVIDYHAIMETLVERNVPDLFNADGYHPAWYPSTLYINEILRRVGLNPLDPPEPLLEWGKSDLMEKVRSGNGSRLRGVLRGSDELPRHATGSNSGIDPFGEIVELKT